MGLEVRIVSMDVFNTKPGDTLEFATINAGHDWQVKDIQERLSINQRYEVANIVVHGWNTEIYLVGFDEPFSSVFFENVNDHTGFKLKKNKNE